MKFDDIVDERHSVRKFHKRKPDWRDIIEAIDSARKSPLAGNVSALKFILVNEPEIIVKLAEAAQQDFIADAHYVVVVVSDTGGIVKSYDERGKIYAHQQAGAAIEQLWLKLVDLKLSTTWVGAFVDDEVRTALKIPVGSEPIALLPIGFPLLKEKQKRKPSIDSVLRFNDYKNKFMKKRKIVDAF